jgi:hypothetical protein
VLDLTLPLVEDDDELSTMIEQRAQALARHLDAERTSGSGGGGTGGSAAGGRGQITVQFFEKKRRKAWLTSRDEEVCWECWVVKVTVAEPRTESGELSLFLPLSFRGITCHVLPGGPALHPSCWETGASVTGRTYDCL